ncbi:MAG: anti-sigma F factor [Clostridia bacterium]
MKQNEMTLIISALPINEGFARSAVAAFCARLNPTVEEIGDIKTAVSEAVTNSIVHAYEYHNGDIKIYVIVNNNNITIEITDYGKGMKDVTAAMQPFFTTGPMDERSGMGFTVMEAFMDELTVKSELGVGTIVKMKKYLKSLNSENANART